MGRDGMTRPGALTSAPRACTLAARSAEPSAAERASLLVTPPMRLPAAPSRFAAVRTPTVRAARLRPEGDR